MKKTVVDGVDCYGTPAIGQNYECHYEDEDYDFITTDIASFTWKGVLANLNTVGLVEVVAC